jgi:hypothetical protein
MKELVLCFVFACAAISSAASPVDQRGLLGGVVVDDQGHPVGGVNVEYHLLRAGRTDRYGRHVFTDPIVSGWVTTGGDGRFTVSDLRAGQYALCALAKLPHQLPSCQWGQGGAPVKVTAGQATGNVRLVLRSGVRLNVHVSDPTASIGAVDIFRGSPHAKRLLLGVVSDKGEYYRVHPVSNGQGVLTHGLAVPRDRVVKLVVDTDLDVSDAAGNAMVSKTPRPITEPEGPDGIEIYLSVRPRSDP